MATAVADPAPPTSASIGTTLGMMQHVDALKPSPLNPRKHFAAFEMADLEANIAKHGVILPIVGRQRGNAIEILDGERRWRAAKASGVTAVPVVFREMTDSDAIEFMLLNSIQRQDLTPLEEASGFKSLIESNKAKYSAAYIADRIGRSEKYVWDRMKLLDLIPILKKLLDHERILVGHAELLCKLKPEDQERAIDTDRRRFGTVEGLWQPESDRLSLDEDDEEPTAKNFYRGLKPVTVKELESWIAHHVRFDVEHMAKAAPLEFAETAQQVEAAEAQPGRGKKVIAITHEYRVADDARDASERTYGSNSWQRADGQEKSKTCEFSVLGTIVAGRGYGSTLQVCVNRDKCTVHFGNVIREREKNAKLRAQGKGSQAAKREKKAAETYDQKWKREAAERLAREKAWQTLNPPLVAEAIAQVKGAKTLSTKQVKFFEDQFEIQINPDACKKHGVTWTVNLVHALLVSEIEHQVDIADDFSDFSKFAAAFGLDVKKLEAIRDQHTPKEEPKPAAPAKAAKKAKKR